jgi:hypothetical protein
MWLPEVGGTCAHSTTDDSEESHEILIYRVSIFDDTHWTLWFIGNAISGHSNTEFRRTHPEHQRMLS